MTCSYFLCCYCIPHHSLLILSCYIVPPVLRQTIPYKAVGCYMICSGWCDPINKQLTDLLTVVRYRN